MFFASDKSGRWYAQKKQSWVAAAGGGWYAVELWINGTLAKACVRLQAGDVLAIRAYRPGQASVVRWRAVLLEEQSPPAIVQSSSETSLFDALNDDALDAIITRLGHSTSTYALAATCRAGRAAVERWLLAPLIPQLVKRSLWLLVGEKWPLTVLHAKVDAMPEACEAELVEMLSPGSFWRGTGSFPFAAYIQTPWRDGAEPVPPARCSRRPARTRSRASARASPPGAPRGLVHRLGWRFRWRFFEQPRRPTYDHVHKVQQALIRRLTAPIQPATRRLRVT